MVEYLFFLLLQQHTTYKIGNRISTPQDSWVEKADSDHIVRDDGTEFVDSRHGVHLSALTMYTSCVSSFLRYRLNLFFQFFPNRL